jgi:hypothetical protein
LRERGVFRVQERVELAHLQRRERHGKGPVRTKQRGGREEEKKKIEHRRSHGNGDARGGKGGAARLQDIEQQKKSRFLIDAGGGVLDGKDT